MAKRIATTPQLAERLAALRREYSHAALNESDLTPNPLTLFHRWLDEAIRHGLPEPHAMALATADRRGRPSARMVLLKSADRGGFVFGTNYESRKGRELGANPYGELVFYWAPMDRQIRVRGRLSKTSRAVSAKIFAARPRGSRLAAWASPQSEPLPDRAALQARVLALEARFAGRDIPLPRFWGGFTLKPAEIEFWQGRPNRLHDRFVYTRHTRGWRVIRLAP